MITLPASIRVVNKSELIDALHIDNPYAHATISLWGAHILSYTPKHDSRERLFLSEKALFDGSKSIRGGIPVCWPWFGSRDDELQAHGYVRTQPWQLLSATDETDYTELMLSPETTQGAGFDGIAELRLTIRIGKTMHVSLSTKNVGEETFTYNAALHSYFAVDDIYHTELKGLSGIYSDKPLNWAEFETPSPYLFTGETDRVHLNPVEKVSIKQSNASTVIQSYGHDSLVVWNPWSEIATSMIDMDNDGYQKMLCVETAVTQGFTVNPQQTHTLLQVIS